MKNTILRDSNDLNLATAISDCPKGFAPRLFMGHVPFN